MRHTPVVALALGLLAVAGGIGACGGETPNDVGPAPAITEVSTPLPERAALAFVVDDPAGADVLNASLAANAPAG